MDNHQTPPERLYIPALAGLYDRLSGLAYPLVRVVAGLWLMPHGAQKLFGWFGGNPEGAAGFFAKIGLEPALPLVYATGMVEFFGGLLLVVGLLTRPVAVAVFVVLFVATFKVHLANGFFVTGGGYEYAMMWMFLALAIAFRGGGPLSLDARLRKEF
ncbi:MAG TPA: DoxX family protein [Rhodospirillales bacterium]|jgi:putative oxidoreductase|nr:DoxX family protein [Rhodospirillales bacterium]